LKKPAPGGSGCIVGIIWFIAIIVAVLVLLYFDDPANRLYDDSPPGQDWPWNPY